MIFTSPYYTLNKKVLKHFELRAKEAPIGNLIAAIFIMDQSSMPQPSMMYKNNVRLGLMIKAHLFFTDKGVFLSNDNLESDFFDFRAILKIDVKKSLLTSDMKMFMNPELISNQVMDLLDVPLKAKAAGRILNLKDALADYVEINNVS